MSVWYTVQYAIYYHLPADCSLGKPIYISSINQPLGVQDIARKTPGKWRSQWEVK